MDVLGPRTDLLSGKPVERVAHQFEVWVEMAFTLGLGQRGHVGGAPIGGHELLGGGQPVGGDAPLCRATYGATSQVGQCIGHEGAGDAGFGVAVGPVGQDGLGGAHGSGGVGHVVGQGLGLIGSASGGQ